MSDDFHPTASWENLRLRAELLRRLREFFDARGFLEVETPILSADTVVDRHLDPFCVRVVRQWPVVERPVSQRSADPIRQPSPSPSPQCRGPPSGVCGCKPRPSSP